VLLGIGKWLDVKRRGNIQSRGRGLNMGKGPAAEAAEAAMDKIRRHREVRGPHQRRQPGRRYLESAAAASRVTATRPQTFVFTTHGDTLYAQW